MTFASPIALTLIALALPIVALYILKVRLRRVPVSTNLFWKQIYEEKTPRSLWQNFRDLTSLLLQLLLLLLLVLAVADPYFSSQLLQAKRVVLVLDNSASMRATDVSPTRLDAARRSALQVVDGLRFRDEMAIVLAGQTPEVIVGMTNHAPTLRQSLNTVQFTDNPTSLVTAMELGRQLLGEHPHGQVIVFSDGCVDETAAPAPDTAVNAATETTASPAPSDKPAEAQHESPTLVPVEYHLFATEASNIGITQLQVRRSLVDPVGYEIFVTVKNASAAPVACRLELSLNDLPVDVIPLRLKPEEVWRRSIEKTSLDGGQISAVLTQIEPATENSDSAKAAVSPPDTPVDLLAPDNVAWALLPARKTQKVFLVSQGNLFLTKVFEANPLVQITTQKIIPEQWPADSIIVLHGALPPTLPPGNIFVIDPIGDCDQWKQGELRENPIVAEQDRISPLMTHIRLDNVLVPQARQLQFTSPPHALATSISGDVIYAEVKRANGKCLVLGVNLDSSDLAFRTVFPILISNALGWFSGTAGELQNSVSTGDLTQLNIEAEAGSVALLESPSRRTLKVTVPDSAAAADRLMTLGPFNEAGIWRLMPEKSTPEKSTTVKSTSRQAVDQLPQLSLAQIAVNLASERETDLRPSKALQESQVVRMNSETWLSKPLWFYLTIAACLITCVEWFLYHRRYIS